MVSDGDRPEPGSRVHARSGPQPAGRSADISPESLYLTEIAIRQARIETLESTVERQEHDRQRLIERYEHLLAAREEADEPATDGRCATDSRYATDGGRRRGGSEGILRRALTALRRRLL